MNLAVAVSKSITNEFWIETQLVDCLFETESIESVAVLENDKFLLDFFGKRKYNVQKYDTNWSEFGLGAIPKRNLDMVSKSGLFVALWDGKSRSIHNMVQIALRYKIPMNIRYFDDKN